MYYNKVVFMKPLLSVCAMNVQVLHNLDLNCYVVVTAKCFYLVIIHWRGGSKILRGRYHQCVIVCI